MRHLKVRSLEEAQSPATVRAVRMAVRLDRTQPKRAR